MSRKEWYEMVVESLTEQEFERLFGCKPLNIMDFDYNFNKVHWSAIFEYLYNECVNESV
jgi:hypothetical protein